MSTPAYPAGLIQNRRQYLEKKSVAMSCCKIITLVYTIVIKIKNQGKYFRSTRAMCVDTTTGKGYCLTIVDNGKKKDQIMLIGESQEYIEKWSTGILKNKTQTNYEKRRASLNRVQNQGKLFDELWAAEDDEDEDGRWPVEYQRFGDPKVESGKAVYPPEHEGWLMKQGGTFKSWNIDIWCSLIFAYRTMHRKSITRREKAKR